LTTIKLDAILMASGTYPYALLQMVKLEEIN